MRFVPPHANPGPNPAAPYRNAEPGQYPGSRISAEFPNAVIAELVAVIQAGGIEPSQADNTQLLQALNARYAVKIHGHVVGDVAGLPTELANRPLGDAVTQVGFLGGNVAQPYFRKNTGGDYVLQPHLGFTPVRQGGGPGQTGNQINIGHSATGPRLSVDGTNYGEFSFNGHVHDAGAIASGTLADARHATRLGVGGAYVTNLDTVFNTGWYSCGPGTTGAPTPGAYYSVHALAFDPNYWVVQWAIDGTTRATGNSKMFFRTFQGGGVGWSAWVRWYGTESELDTRYRQTRGLTAFQTAGAYSFTVPADVSFVFVELVGGGGGGGGAVSAAGSGGGGGAGGFASGWVGVTPGQVITVTVGAGGAGGVAADGAAGGNGGSTSFGAAMSATGGVGGLLSSAFGNGGGIGGAGAGGQITRSGGDGTDGAPAAYWLVKGGDGAASAFGGGGRAATTTGFSGKAPGAGGGAKYNGDGNGGAGADGAVLVRW